jgi:hypothetical protein
VGTTNWVCSDVTLSAGLLTDGLGKAGVAGGACDLNLERNFSAAAFCPSGHFPSAMLMASSIPANMDWNVRWRRYSKKDSTSNPPRKKLKPSSENYFLSDGGWKNPGLARFCRCLYRRK